MSVTKTAFFGRFLRFLRFPFFFPSFPFFCSESERFCVIFPLFVHNPSGFGFFSPFSFTIRALFVVRRPQSPPKPPTECPVTRDLPQRAPRRMRQPRRRKARPVSARLGGERGLGEPGSTAPRLRATATRPPGGVFIRGFIGGWMINKYLVRPYICCLSTCGFSKPRMQTTRHRPLRS